MSWIVVGEEGGKVKLVSKSGTNGMLPKGAYLTVERGGSKFILRVDDSRQSELFSPSPLVVEMDLTPLKQDQQCQNVVAAYRVHDVVKRTDGYIDFLPPQSVARRSNQEEINMAMGSGTAGPKVFVATIHSSQNQILRDETGVPITAHLPVDMFFHQILICGRTGSGKTVATKYLAQYFVEELEGAVLAINVKDVDFLKMDKPSLTKNADVTSEWAGIGEKPRGMDNFVVYYPATVKIDWSQGVAPEVCQKITLDVKKLEPESLTGLLQGISDVAAQNLPNIFRWWQRKAAGEDRAEFTFGGFVRYFIEMGDSGREFSTLNSRGEESTLPMHKSTFDNVVRNLDYAVEFFDNPDAASLDETDVLVKGKMSVINVAGNKGVQFGSVLLRDLLHRIVDAKSSQRSPVPILIIIDEVHQFYNTESSREALGDLDTICRTGRSQKIGVIFSSQNPSDIPRGLSNVINTQLFFKSDASTVRSFGLRISEEEMETLRKGFAVGRIHELSLLRIVKFPMALAGVFE